MFKNSFTKSIGFSIILYYLIFTYLIQFILHSIFPEIYNVKYRIAEDFGIIAVLVVVLFILLLIFLDLIIPKVKYVIKSNFIFKVASTINLLLITFFLIFSIYFASRYGVDFRHHHRLNEAGMIIKLLWFLKMYVYFYVFYCFSKIINKENINSLMRIKLFIILIGWFLSLTSSLQVPLIIIIIMLFTPQGFKNKLFFVKNNKNIFLSFKNIFIFIILIVSLSIMVFLGYANKIGFERAIELFTDIEKIYLVFTHIITRVSSSYASLVILSNEYLFDINLQFSIIEGHIQTFLLRLSSILPIFDYQLTEIKSVSRSNYLLIHVSNYLPISGTSPGLLATIFYIPIFPISFILVGLYTVMIIRTVNRYINTPSSNLSILTKLILFYLLFILFESPLNLLIIMHPIFLFFILFISVSFFERKNKIMQIR